MTDFEYGEAPSSSRLGAWIINYWEFRVTAPGDRPLSHHVPPDGCLSIASVPIGPGGAPQLMASGPWLEPFVVPVVPGSLYRGARCRPEAGALLLKTAPDRMINRSQPLAIFRPDLAGSLAAALRNAWTLAEFAGALDRELEKATAELPQPDSLVRTAVGRIEASRGELPVGELADLLNVSSRTLLRRFRAATGMTPKQFARVCRFRAAVAGMLTDRPGWARLATRTGFADQAHMIHEFRDLVGLSPETLQAQMRRTRHGDIIG